MLTWEGVEVRPTGDYRIPKIGELFLEFPEGPRPLRVLEADPAFHPDSARVIVEPVARVRYFIECSSGDGACITYPDGSQESYRTPDDCRTALMLDYKWRKESAQVEWKYRLGTLVETLNWKDSGLKNWREVLIARGYHVVHEKSAWPNEQWEKDNVAVVISKPKDFFTYTIWVDGKVVTKGLDHFEETMEWRDVLIQAGFKINQNSSAEQWDRANTSVIIQQGTYTVWVDRNIKVEGTNLEGLEAAVKLAEVEQILSERR